jgi:hypothetical protein
MSKKHSIPSPAPHDERATLEQRNLAEIIKNALAEGRDRTQPEIRQGVKSTVETMPVPVRLEVEQVHMLKMLAAIERKTVSGIIRDCVAAYIAARAGEASLPKGSGAGE